MGSSLTSMAPAWPRGDVPGGVESAGISQNGPRRISLSILSWNPQVLERPPSELSLAWSSLPLGQCY